MPVGFESGFRFEVTGSGFGFKKIEVSDLGSGFEPHITGKLAILSLSKK